MNKENIGQKAELEKFLDYLEKNYGPNCTEWSQINLPTGESDMYKLFVNTTNGCEAIHRSLNRHVKEYSRGRLTTCANYLRKFYQEQIEIVTLLEKNQLTTDLSSYFEVI